jgi:hypothetical protein
MLEPTLWREKSPTIEAMQWDGSYDSQMAIVNWAWMSTGCKYVPISGWCDERYFLEIVTPHGPMRADEGDWVVRNTRNEFYPCTPTLFEQIYEPDTN